MTTARHSHLLPRNVNVNLDLPPRQFTTLCEYGLEIKDECRVLRRGGTMRARTAAGDASPHCRRPPAAPSEQNTATLASQTTWTGRRDIYYRRCTQLV